MTEDRATYNPDSDIVLLASDTMKGDLITALVDELKAAPNVWPKLSQQQQDEVIFRFERRVGAAIREAVRMIASDNRPSIEATLEQITAKDGIKAVITLSKSHKQRHDLLDAVGQAVLIVVADAEPYCGGEKPQAEPDQMPLVIATTADFAEAYAGHLEAAGGDEAGDTQPEPGDDAQDALEALDAGIEAASEPELAEQAAEDLPEDPDATPYIRNDSAVLDAILLIDEEWTGFGDDDAANLARIAEWSDDDCELVEAFCIAVSENPDDIPLRPEVIGGPLPGQLHALEPEA